MSNAAKVNEFLDKAQVFYFLTTDGDQPKGRPFSFKLFENDRLYFGCGTFKEVYRQLTQNPKVEVVAMADGQFMRYDGAVSFVQDDALLAKTRGPCPNSWTCTTRTAGRWPCSISKTATRRSAPCWTRSRSLTSSRPAPDIPASRAQPHGDRREIPPRRHDPPTMGRRAHRPHGSAASEGSGRSESRRGRQGRQGLERKSFALDSRPLGSRSRGAGRNATGRVTPTPLFYRFLT